MARRIKLSKCNGFVPFAIYCGQELNKYGKDLQRFMLNYKYKWESFSQPSSR